MKGRSRPPDGCLLRRWSRTRREGSCVFRPKPIATCALKQTSRPAAGQPRYRRQKSAHVFAKVFEVSSSEAGLGCSTTEDFWLIMETGGNQDKERLPRQTKRSTSPLVIVAAIRGIGSEPKERSASWKRPSSPAVGRAPTRAVRRRRISVGPTRYMLPELGA